MKSRRSERTLAPRLRISAALVLVCAHLGFDARAQAPATDGPGSAASEPAASVAAPLADQAIVAEARQAFREGSSFARRARWDEALSAFEQSYALRAHPVTSYNIAYCERAMGHYTRAHLLFARALREHDPRKSEALPADLLASTRQYLQEIESRVARVRVRLAPRDAAVLVDGRPLERVRANEAPLYFAGTREPGPAESPARREFELWVDPGPHVFVVSVPSAPEQVLTQRFRPAARVTLELRVRSTGGVRREQSRPERPAHPSRTWSTVAFGVGAAGLLTGGIAGALALSKHDDLSEACGGDRGQCPRERAGDIEAMERWADVATVGFALGAVGVGAGVVLLLTRPEQEGRRPQTVRVSLSQRGAELSGRF